MRSTDLEGI